MTPAMKLAHDRAMVAMAQAKQVREAWTGKVMPAEVKEQFDAYMAEFTTASEAFHAIKKQEEQFASLDAASEQFELPAGPALHGTPELQVRTTGRQSVEQLAAAKTRHMDAFRRFVSGGAACLDRNEQAAYMVGAQAMFGDNPQQALMGLLPQERHALVGTVDSLGGFLVPDQFMSEFITELAGFTTFRQLARVKQTSSSAAVFMTLNGSGDIMYSSGLTGSWRGEGWVVGGSALPTQNQPRFGRERVPVHIWCPDVIELTMELLSDSSVNLDAEIRRLLAETRAIDEDSAFTLGTGVGCPLGIMTEASNGNITSVVSKASNGQSYAGLVNLFTGLPAQYRAKATWMFNSVTLGLLMQLEDTEGHNIFPTNTIPTTLFNRPIVINEWIADGNADNNYSMVFGDFSYYAIADRMDMRIIRLTERFAPNVGIMAVSRVGGQLLKTAPFRVQKVSAS